MSFYLEGIRAVDPSAGLDAILHIIINDEGIITYCAPEVPSADEIPASATRILGQRLTCFTGFCDMHAHFCEPGMERRETINTGSLAAANGGFTAVCAIPDAGSPIDTLPIARYIADRATASPLEVVFAGSLTKKGEGKELAPLRGLADSGAKCFSDGSQAIPSAVLMRRIFEYVADFDGLIAGHCDYPPMTEGAVLNEGAISAQYGYKAFPAVAEAIALSRDILLAEYCGNRRYHASRISTALAVRTIAEAQARGQRITAAVTAHHIACNEQTILEKGALAKTNPPLRTDDDIKTLIEGLRSGVISAIVSGHTPVVALEKEVELQIAAPGIPSLETTVGMALQVLYHQNGFPLLRIAELLSLQPRTLLGLPVPTIRVGEKADFSLVNTDCQWSVDAAKFLSAQKNTPFQGTKLQAKPVATIRGNVLFCSTFADNSDGLPVELLR